jgi:autotransporter-associated beta strand protein
MAIGIDQRKSGTRKSSSRIASAVLAVGCAAVTASTAEATTWADSTLAGNANWTSGGNWVGNNPPADSSTTDTAVFTSVANVQPNFDVSRAVAGIDFQIAAGGATLTGSPGVTMTLGPSGIKSSTQTSGTDSVSVPNIVLSVGQTWTLFSNTSSSSTSTFNVSSNINLNGKFLTISSNRNSAAGNTGVVNVSSVISGNAGGTSVAFSGASANTNTINVTGSSSYTATTIIRGVNVSANSLANAGNNSAFGSSSDIVLGDNPSFATLTFKNLSATGTTDRLLSLNGTATGGYTVNNNDSTYTVSFNNAGSTVGGTASALKFILGGTNTGANTFGQVINDKGTGSNITTLNKSGAGTWILSNANTYTGGTSIAAGTLGISQNGSLGTGSVDFGGNATLSAATALTSNNAVNTNGFTATFTNTATGSGNVYNVSGLVSGNGNVKAHNVNFTFGTVRFSNDSNSYTGTFNTSSGNVEFTSVADAGANSALGAGSTAYALANGDSAIIFRYVGAGNSSTNRAIDWSGRNGGLVLDASGTGTVKYLASNNLRSGAGGTNSTTNVTLQGTNTGDNTIAQAINDATGQSTSVIKSGAGAWALSGNSTYTGSTSMSNGTLKVTGSLGATAVSVAGGILTGSGTLGGPVSVGGSGTLQPGDGMGGMTINSTLSLGGTTKVEVNSSTAGADHVFGVTTLTYGGSLQVSDLAVAGHLVEGASFDVFDTTSYSGGFANFTNVGSIGTAGGGSLLPTLASGLRWQMDYSTGSLSVVHAPEPASASLLALAGCGLLRRRRRSA